MKKIIVVLLSICCCIISNAQLPISEKLLLLEWTKATTFIDAYTSTNNEDAFFAEVEKCMKGEMVLSAELVCNSVLIQTKSLKLSSGIEAEFQKLAKGLSVDNLLFEGLSQKLKNECRHIDYDWIFESEIYTKPVKMVLLDILLSVDLENALDRRFRRLPANHEIMYVKQFHKTSERKEIIYFYSFVRNWSLYFLTYPYQNLNSKSADDIFIDLIDKVYPTCNDGKMLGALMNLQHNCEDNHSSLNLSSFKYHIDSTSFFYYDNFDAKPFPGKLLLSTGLIINTELQSDDSALKIGDTILTINGMDYQKIIDSFDSYYSASSPWAMEYKVSRSLQYNLVASRFDLVLKKGNSIEKVSLDSMQLEKVPFVKNRVNSKLINTDSYLYINPNIISNRKVKKLLKANYQGQPSIIIDLRDRPYKNGNYKAIIEASCNESKPIATAWRKVEIPGIWKKEANLTFVKNPKQSIFTKGEPQFYFLIDETMQSAAETWAMIYRTYFPNAIFVGRNTSGTNGGTPSFDLPYHIKITMCQYAFEWSDGRQFQKIGIRPDVFISKLPLTKEDEIFLKAADFAEFK